MNTLRTNQNCSRYDQLLVRFLTASVYSMHMINVSGKSFLQESIFRENPLFMSVSLETGESCDH